MEVQSIPNIIDVNDTTPLGQLCTTPGHCFYGIQPTPIGNSVEGLDGPAIGRCLLCAGRVACGGRK